MTRITSQDGHFLVSHCFSRISQTEHLGEIKIPLMIDLYRTLICADWFFAIVPSTQWSKCTMVIIYFISLCGHKSAAAKSRKYAADFSKVSASSQALDHWLELNHQSVWLLRGSCSSAQIHVQRRLNDMITRSFSTKRCPDSFYWVVSCI